MTSTRVWIQVPLVRYRRLKSLALLEAALIVWLMGLLIGTVVGRHPQPAHFDEPPAAADAPPQRS
jgi:hypothetical protein